MSCFHGYDFTHGHEDAFSVEASQVCFGPGVLKEAGAHLAAAGLKRVALFTDVQVRAAGHTRAVEQSLRAAGVDFVLYDSVHVEPTNVSFEDAARFAREAKVDGYVSVGGGSVMDTCKAALLYATYPAELLAYVNAPLGEGRAVPGAVPMHLACPTTCGTGSECTGIAVFDHLQLQVKTGIASRRLRPTLALVDPTCTRTLPAGVVAASGFDVLCHALESYTARPFTKRAPPGTPQLRPMSQGRNPWSDLGSLEALRVGGANLVAAVQGDIEARERLSWAATLAGIAFGNAGVHLPHAMSYSVAGRVRDYRHPGYATHEVLVPHGVSVVVGAPSVFRATAATSPERHLEAARALGVTTAALPADAGELVATKLISLMRATGVPNGVGGVGYTSADLDALAQGAFVQKRLVDNAPLAMTEASMRGLFEAALAYW